VVNTLFGSMLLSGTLWLSVLIVTSLFASVLYGSVMTAPQKPRVIVDTDLPTGWDGTADASPADSSALTTALAAVDQSSGIYIIELSASVTYSGTFVIDNNAGTDWLIIRSSAYASLPSGTRTTPAATTNLAKISQPAHLACMRVDFGGHHVRFIGIEFTTAVATTVLTVVGFDSSYIQPSTEAEVCSYIIFDRCYLTSTSETNRCRTGIQVNCDNFACIDSYIDNIKDSSDAQAILFHLGTGLLVHNCYLEATGENIMAGGNDTLITDRLPEDLTISKCYFFKPDKWNPVSDDYNDQNWNCKNLFELKMCRRCHIHSCVLEGSWVDGQAGYAISIKIANQTNTNPWAETIDVWMENCLIKRSGRGFHILGSDGEGYPSGSLQRVLIRNILFHTLGGESTGSPLNEDIAELFGTQGKIVLFTTIRKPIKYFTFDHVTFVAQEGHHTTGMVAETADIINVDNLTIKNSIFPAGQFRFTPTFVDNGRIRNLTLSGNGWFFHASDNDLATRLTNFSTDFPNDIKADTITDVEFTDNSSQDYTLANDSPFKDAADDGTDCGVNFTELNAAISGVET